jgi:hypothetical protein
LVTDNAEMKRILLPALFIVLLAGCTSDGERTKRADAGQTFSPPGFAEGSVLFTRGSRLQLFDATENAQTDIAELGSGDVAVSPDGAAIVYVTGGRARDDFVEEPILRLLEISSGDKSTIGPGLAPSFSPSGDLLAFLEPAGPRRCEGEVCEGDVQVSFFSDGEVAEVLEPARWVPLGWAGERLMVIDGADPSQVQLVSGEGESTALDVAPGNVWGGSPDGERLVLLAGDGVEVRDLGPTGLDESSTLVALEGTLGQGAWARDSSTVAAVLLGEPRGGIPETELVTIAAEGQDGGRVTTVSGSEGAQGQVVWAPAGDSLAYVRSAPPRGLNLEAVRCESPPEGSCRSLFSWRRGVTLLHLY